MKISFNSCRVYLAGVFLFVSLSLSGCGLFSSAVENVSGLVGLDETGTVIAKRAQIRTSYAVVAGDLLEVSRGDRLDILEETTFEKVRWYRVRANDEDKTEGWIEAQNVILGEILDKSKKLSEDNKNSQPQATGQLRAASNLRLTPEIKDENILLKLDGGSKFEIIASKFVPKIQDVSGETNTQNPEIEAAKEDDDKGEKIEDKYDIWYQVRLDPSQSPAPVGWLFGRQVELQIPTDIVFYQQNNRKFVTWQRVDNVVTEKVPGTESGEGIQVTKPGSWIILTRTNEVKAIDGVEPDFDGIMVLGYDKFDQSHYMIYRNNEIWGTLPMIMEGEGDNKSFVLNLKTTGGKVEPRKFTVIKDKARLRIKPPEDITVK